MYHSGSVQFKNSQYVLSTILETAMVAMSPILCFTAQEMYVHSYLYNPWV